MSLPTLEKTWQFNVNQSGTASGNVTTDCRATIFKIKQSLTGFASNPWTVALSSNGSSSGASDYWASSSDVIWNNAGSAHSWIVLQQTGVTGGPVQLLIDCGTNNPSLIVVMASTSGFTGGSTLNRPTATDETLLYSASNYSLPNSSAVHVLHVMMSTDGQSTRLFVFSGGSRWMFITIETLAGSDLAYQGAVFGKENALVFADLYSSSKWICKNGSTIIYGYTATQTYANVAVCNANAGAISNISNAYPMVAMSVYSETPGGRGRCGRIQDMWFGSSALASGSTFPATPDDKQFAQFGPVILPWNGTTPVIT